MQLDNSESLVTKALVYEHDPDAYQQLRNFCQENQIVGLKSTHCDSLKLLQNNTDLGAIFVSDQFLIAGVSGIELVRQIHTLRPELPIFYRVEQLPSDNKSETAIELAAEPDNAMVACCYRLSSLEPLRDSIQSHLFCTHYPVALIRAMQEISLESIQANLRNCRITVDTPYLVKDKVIYGELMSMIPIESDWYRGYMMLQSTESEVVELIQNGMTPLNPKDTSFRFVNSLLNEITNLIWGGIKSRFSNSSGDASEPANNRTQVPIAVNHLHKYISFGTDEPQLCFHYRIENEFEPTQVVDLYQKFVFNLSWYPENFEDSDQTVNNLVDAGELEFF